VPNPVNWRWDQGRLQYFDYENIKKIASALVKLEGTVIRVPGQDPLREPLMRDTNLPFAVPSTHSIWRNYARVFGCTLLAGQLDDRLVCTSLCHAAAGSNNQLLADDYFSHVATRFYFPGPMFKDYSPDEPQIFPFCAVIKFLLAKAAKGEPAIVSVEELLSKVVGNDCTGTESISHYERLQPTAYAGTGDEIRQIRELLRFISQLSFLKWASPVLFLDVDYQDKEVLSQLEQLAQPVIETRSPDRATELLALGAFKGAIQLSLVEKRIAKIEPRVSYEDQVFTESKKIRVTHLRTERSKKLRDLYFRAHPYPYVCDMCTANISETYPWTENLLEVHHLLPLSSPLHLEREGTSIKDLVGICPNCHRATHMFYRNWLNDEDLDDFRSYDEAKQVYLKAKENVGTAA
jgi:hypothetical protein